MADRADKADDYMEEVLRPRFVEESIKAPSRVLTFDLWMAERIQELEAEIIWLKEQSEPNKQFGSAREQKLEEAILRVKQLDERGRESIDELPTRDEWDEAWDNLMAMVEEE